MLLLTSAVATQYKEQMAYCLWGQIPQDWSLASPSHLLHRHRLIKWNYLTVSSHITPWVSTLTFVQTFLLQHQISFSNV